MYNIGIGEDMKSSTDIWFSSFLILNGHEVVRFEINEKKKGVFFFKVSQEEWIDLKLKFNRSEISQVKYIHTSLKDLLY